MSHKPRTPALFVSHGAPSEALHDDDAYASDLAKFSENSLQGCRGIIIASAHWLTPGPIQITSGEKPETIHDFRGFQRELYEIRYPAPGSPELAKRVFELFSENSVSSTLNPTRGWDHGAWVPLRFLRPEADLPVVQVSLPLTESPREIMKMGHSLSKLREEGYLIMGSGGAVHNLRELRWEGRRGGVDSRAMEFDTWLKRALVEARIEDLIDFENKAPKSGFAHPTHEHFFPLFFVIGSSSQGDEIHFVHESFQYGSLSMLCFSLGPKAGATVARPAFHGES